MKDHLTRIQIKEALRITISKCEEIMLENKLEDNWNTGYALGNMNMAELFLKYIEHHEEELYVETDPDRDDVEK